jgi:hypothetical protein
MMFRFTGMSVGHLSLKSSVKEMFSAPAEIPLAPAASSETTQPSTNNSTKTAGMFDDDEGSENDYNEEEDPIFDYTDTGLKNLINTLGF